jgi:hypothetical protein
MRFQPFHAQAGGRVAAGAEGQARVQFQDQGVRIGASCHDGTTQMFLPMWRKLRLGQTHPVLLLHLAGGELRRAAGRSGRQPRHDHGLVVILVGQRDHAAVFPRRFGRFHARLAEQRLFRVGAFVGIFHGHRQGATSISASDRASAWSRAISMTISVQLIFCALLLKLSLCRSGMSASFCSR